MLASEILACKGTVNDSFRCKLDNLVELNIQADTFSLQKRTSPCATYTNHQPSLDMLAYVSKITEGLTRESY